MGERRPVTVVRRLQSLCSDALACDPPSRTGRPAAGPAMIRLDIAGHWSVPSPVSPPPASAAEDALFELVLGLAERVVELAASAERSGRLEELVALTADLDLFARAALRAGATPI